MQTIFANSSKFWNRIVLSIAGLGILLIVFDRFFSSDITLNLGVTLFSVAGILIGLEAIVRRKIILQSPYHRRLSQTYIGFAAVAQGLLIIFLGSFLIGLLIIDYFNSGRSLFEHFIKRPGIPFLIFSLICLLTAISIGIGSVEEKQGSKFVIILNLLTSRILGSTILIIIGIIFLCLGILEIANPNYFDSLGGGFLEILFLGKKSS